MSTKSNLILDLGIFSIFLIVANPHLTGSTVHEWLALSLAGTVLTHILVHWKWVMNVAVNFFKNLWHQSRLNLAVNTLFFVTMLGSLISGLMISQSVMPALGIQLAADRSMRMLHSTFSNASMAVMAVHVALHWKWVINSLGRYILNPIQNLFRRPAGKGLAVQVENK